MSTLLEIVGRQKEVGVLDSFLRESAPGVLVLEGEAGIGKTTLWRYGVERAGEEWRVLACDPTEAESGLAFTAAGDLLEPVAGEVIAALPEPPRRALAAALLLEDVEEVPVEPRAVAVGFLRALRELAGERPVLVAVDDIQWLDPPSAFLLEFALRRAEDEPISFLFTRRASAETQTPLGLDRLSPERVRPLSVGPISIGALHRLLRTRLGVPFPRRQLRLVHETAGGNPFYALEFGRMLKEHEVEPQAGVPLPIPATLSEVVGNRIASLAPEVRAALAAVAALAAPTVSAVGAEDELDAAAQAGIVEVSGGRVQFTHPLLAAAAYSGLPAGEQRRLHARLAEVVTDPTEHARHLALAVDGPDRHVAATLEDAASRARARGAWEPAADLAERALLLTPTGQIDDAWRRAFVAAEWKRDVGDYAGATELLEQVVSRKPPATVLSRAHHLLGLTRWCVGDHAQGLAQIELASSEADDAAVRATIERDAGMLLVANWEVHRAEPHVRAALELSERLEDPTLLARTLPAVAMTEFVGGRGTRFDLLERALEFEAFVRRERTALSPRCWIALILSDTGDLAAARPLLHDLVRRTVEVGDMHYYCEFAAFLADLELRGGDCPSAAASIREAIDVARQLDSEILGFALAVKAAVQAHRGDIDTARETLEEAASACTTFLADSATLATVAAFIATSLDDPHETLGAVDGLFDRLRESGVGEPTLFRFLPDQIEALVAVDRLDEARELLEWLEERGRALDRPWALATGGRCRALAHTAEGEFGAALASLDAALIAHEGLPMPLELARTLLAKGTIERRARQRRAARESLEQAIEIFERLGTPLWTRRARAERARIGGRVAGRGLTQKERRIAELVAKGLSNKEVAARLFVTSRTVEGHLTRIYQKLGVRSRAQLAHRLPAPTG